MRPFASSTSNILKPVYFLMDPEYIHDRMLGVGKILGRFGLSRWKAHFWFDYKNPKLEQTVLDIKFTNPIGLAAGFDKNAEITDILPDVGFGFEKLVPLLANRVPVTRKRDFGACLNRNRSSSTMV